MPLDGYLISGLQGRLMVVTGASLGTSVRLPLRC